MSNTNSWSVYAHTLKQNPNKLYIGITGRKPELRWNEGKGYRKGYFYNALKKYGFDEFNHIILFENLSKQLAELIEIELIKTLKFQGFQLYNICSGGTVNDGRKGKHNTDWHNKQISEANKGKKLTDVQIENLRQLALNKKSGWLSKENAKSPFCKLTGTSNHRARTVYSFDLNWNFLKQFETMNDASKFYGINQSAISACCRHRLNKTHGYRFSYERNDSRAIS